MGQFVGIDFGTRMVKAAVCGGSGDQPALVALGDGDPLFPVAVQRMRRSDEYRLGPEAFAVRTRNGSQVALDFRDRLQDLTAHVQIDGTRIEGLELLQIYWREVAARIQSVISGVTAVAVAIPDHWRADCGALPPALYCAGWRPRVFVREWVSVLGLQANPAPELMLVSFGYGVIRGTLVRCESDGWRAVATASTSSPCGAVLRRRLTDYLSSDVIREVRRDPREDAEASQALDDALERAIRKLQTNSEAALEFSLGGRRFRRGLTRSDLSERAQHLRDDLRRMVEHLGSAAHGCPIVVWGEFARLVPISEWLGRADVTAVPLDGVAAGAARVCRWLSSKKNVPLLSRLPTTDRIDGGLGYSGTRSPAIPVLDFLPANLAGRSPSVPQLRLVGDSKDSLARPILVRQFRLGRRRDLEWPFDPDRYPHVSQLHAEIVRDGETYILRDLNSTNGSFVNDRPATDAVPLHDGDLIRLGRDDPQIRFERPGERDNATMSPRL